MNMILNTYTEDLKSIIKEVTPCYDLNINLSDFSKENSALIIVDMINGFCKKGNLYSKDLENLILPIANLAQKASNLKFPILAFCDYHDKNSIEFENYPIHCIKSTEESKLVNELNFIDNTNIINKNSTNGFVEDKFQQFLKNNKNISNFIIVGDCTDICVQQFALTLKTYFNKNNIKSRIIIPINLVDTYNSKNHPRNILNLIALYTMKINGIEVINNVL